MKITQYVLQNHQRCWTCTAVYCAPMSAQFTNVECYSKVYESRWPMLAFLKCWRGWRRERAAVVRNHRPARIAKGWVVIFLALCLPAFGQPTPIVGPPQEPMVSLPPMTLQAAVAAGIKDLDVTSSGELTDTLRLPDGTKLSCAEGVVLTWRFPGEAKNGIEIGSNVDIRACILGFGEIIREPAPTAEGPHAISCRGANAVRISDVECQGWPGDGLYLGAGRDSAKAPSTEVIIEDSRMVGNARNGLTIASARNVTVERCKFAGQKGAKPEAGVDIEPNQAADWVENLRFLDCLFEANAGSAIAVNVAQLTDKSKPGLIEFVNPVLRLGEERNIPIYANGWQSSQTVPPVRLVVAGLQMTYGKGE